MFPALSCRTVGGVGCRGQRQHSAGVGSETWAPSPVPTHAHGPQRLAPSTCPGCEEQASQASGPEAWAGGGWAAPPGFLSHVLTVGCRSMPGKRETRLSDRGRGKQPLKGIEIRKLGCICFERQSASNSEPPRGASASRLWALLFPSGNSEGADSGHGHCLACPAEARAPAHPPRDRQVLKPLLAALGSGSRRSEVGTRAQLGNHDRVRVRCLWRPLWDMVSASGCSAAERRSPRGPPA